MGAADAKLSLEADGGGWRYNFGAIVFPEEKFSLGFAYRSGTKVDQSGTITVDGIAPGLQPLFGGSRFKTAVDTTIDFPDIVSFGIAYRPTRKLTFAVDCEWVGWSSFDKQELDLRDEVPQAGFSDSSTPLDWKDSWLFKAGAQYSVNDKLALRGGYVFVESPVPDHTLTPAAPESDQHDFAIGFGYKMTKAVLDFFYMAAFFEDNKVDNNVLIGEYENFVHYIGFSWGYRF
jgi:long-chain fatty acid transport protein